MQELKAKYAVQDMDKLYQEGIYAMVSRLFNLDGLAFVRSASEPILLKMHMNTCHLLWLWGIKRLPEAECATSARGRAVAQADADLNL